MPTRHLSETLSLRYKEGWEDRSPWYSTCLALSFLNCVTNPYWGHITECGKWQKSGKSTRFPNAQGLQIHSKSKYNKSKVFPTVLNSSALRQLPHSLGSEYTTHTLLPMVALTHNTNECCLIHLGSNPRLFYAINCTKFCELWRTKTPTLLLSLLSMWTIKLVSDRKSWRGGSVANSIDYSYKRPRFSSQHSHRARNHPQLKFQGSDDLFWPMQEAGMYIRIDIHSGKTPMHIK